MKLSKAPATPNSVERGHGASVIPNSRHALGRDDLDHVHSARRLGPNVGQADSQMSEADPSIQFRQSPCQLPR